MCPYLHILGLEVPMYGLMMAIGFLVCSVIAWFRTRKRNMVGENLIIIAAMVLLFALIGGMLMFLLVTYTPEQIIGFIKEGKWDMLAGGIVDIVWYLNSGGIFDIYEIIPGFIAGILAIVIVSLCTKVPQEILDEFDSVKHADFSQSANI